MEARPGEKLPRENGAQRVGGRFGLSKGKKDGISVANGRRPNSTGSAVAMLGLSQLFIFHPPVFD